MEAILRARAFQAQHYRGEAALIWHRLPVARRALVLILLFLGQVGELRVVLTKRLSQLRNFPGHISLPGGKADSGLELPWMVARRETSEEIGLSENNAELLSEYGFTVDHVTELPCYLSRTFSAVKPCVGFLNVKKDEDGGDSEERLLRDLKLKVNPGESSSIFLCPLHDFLYPGAHSYTDTNSVSTTEAPAKEAIERTHHRVKWGGIPWNLRSYTFPQVNPGEAHWLQGFHDLSATEEEASSESDSNDFSDSDSSKRTGADLDANLDGDSANGSVGGDRRVKRPKEDVSNWGQLGSRRDSVTNEKIYDVWGLTANILHDLAEVVYLQPEHTAKPQKHLGEEELIWSVWNYGHQMRTKDRTPVEAELIGANPADAASFGDLLPRTEFNRLKRIYKM